MPVALPAALPWNIPSHDGELVSELQKGLGISPLLAQLLLNRSITDCQAADQFLSPRLSQLHDPRLLADMDKAVARILLAKQRGELIRVFGDYDVDGTTATALLCGLFTLIGARHDYVIPRREGDGYGLSINAVEQAARDGVAVMITVDNGVSATAEVVRANQLGVDMIITDHHTVESLPPAHAVIHPTRNGQSYPFPSLCGAGIALKLAHGVLQELDSAGSLNGPAVQEFFATALALASMATVCDVVPMIGENRIIASLGLEAIPLVRMPGLRALCRIAKLSGKVNAQDVAFQLGPRINAASRMGEDSLAIRLLLERDPDRADELAKELDSLNLKRRRIERTASTAAKSEVDSDEIDTGSQILVVAGERYPAGIAGIIAARLVDKYGKPALVLSIGEDGIAKGSGRAPRGYNLHAALTTVSHLMDRWGGHAQAVGLTIQAERLEELRVGVNLRAHEFDGQDVATPGLDLEASIPPTWLVPGIARDVEILGPFGEANPEPLIGVTGARVAGKPRLVGKTNQHLSMAVAAPRGGTVKAIGFNQAASLPLVESSKSVRLAFRPQLSTWGMTEGELELHLRDVASDEE